MWPPELRPMLASAGALPRASDAWVFEVKWDGVRVLVRTDGDGRIDLRSRTGQDLTPAFPEFNGLAKQLGTRRLTLDGELIAFDAAGLQRFQAVQRRLRTADRAAIRRLSSEQPVTLMAFDLLWEGDDDLTPLPWHERRERLEELGLTGTHWQVPPVHNGDPSALLAATREHRLEGIVAKRRDSPYLPGRRSKAWTKHKHVRHQAVVIGGFTPGTGARRGSFGALQVGIHDEDGVLRHAGGVGSGFRDRDLQELRELLDPLVVEASPFSGARQPPRGTRFVQPTLAAEIEFVEWSDDGSLRHPAFRGLRTDLDASNLRREPLDAADTSPSSAGSDLPPKESEVAAVPAPRARRHAAHAGDQGVVELDGIAVPVKNLDKPMYPQYPSGFTKGDVLAYYATVAPVLVPHLRGRAITRLRFPHGSGDLSFFEKRAPAHRPGWVETVSVESGSAGVIDFVTLGPPATLLWLANLAALELHPSLHLGATPTCPTVLVFDLDPGDPATIVECCRVGLRVRDLLDGLGLQAWAKTTGSKGLQVYAPLNVPTSYETTKPLAQAIATLLAERDPQLITAQMAKRLRPGKVFIDWSQNDAHKTTISVYSLRARESPTVSTPVSWDEVEHCAQTGAAELLRFTATDVLDRLDRHGDRFAAVLELQQDPPQLSSE